MKLKSSPRPRRVAVLEHAIEKILVFYAVKDTNWTESWTMVLFPRAPILLAALEFEKDIRNSRNPKERQKRQ